MGRSVVGVTTLLPIPYCIPSLPLLRIGRSVVRDGEEVDCTPMLLSGDDDR